MRISLLISSTLFSYLLVGDIIAVPKPDIYIKQNHHMAEKPSVSSSVLASKHFTMKKLAGNQYQISTSTSDLMHYSYLQDKNPTISEHWKQAPLAALIHKYNSHNIFQVYQPYGHIMTNNASQPVRFLSLSFNRQQVTAIVRPFIEGRKLNLINGAGTITMNTTCMFDRIVCDFGCFLVINVDSACADRAGLITAKENVLTQMDKKVESSSYVKELRKKRKYYKGIKNAYYDIEFKSAKLTKIAPDHYQLTSKPSDITSVLLIASPGRETSISLSPKVFLARLSIGYASFGSNPPNVSVTLLKSGLSAPFMLYSRVNAKTGIIFDLKPLKLVKGTAELHASYVGPMNMFVDGVNYDFCTASTVTGQWGEEYAEASGGVTECNVDYSDSVGCSICLSEHPDSSPENGYVGCNDGTNDSGGEFCAVNMNELAADPSQTIAADEAAANVDK